MRRACKEKMCPTLRVTCEKRYGYRHRYSGACMFNEKGEVQSAIAKILPCSRKECPKYENIVGEFKHCSMCLTVYCSNECQKKDWNNHKEFCKSQGAFMSQLNKWEDNYEGDLLFHGEDYKKKWDNWINSPRMKMVLKHINKQASDFNQD